jgi:hypothetical protein
MARTQTQGGSTLHHLTLVLMAAPKTEGFRCEKGPVRDQNQRQGRIASHTLIKNDFHSEASESSCQQPLNLRCSLVAILNHPAPRCCWLGACQAYREPQSVARQASRLSFHIQLGSPKSTLSPPHSLHSFAAYSPQKHAYGPHSLTPSILFPSRTSSF